MDPRKPTRTSRMTIRTYRLGPDDTRAPEPCAPESVVRARDPLNLPASPLAWPLCRCLRCRTGAGEYPFGAPPSGN